MDELLLARRHNANRILAAVFILLVNTANSVNSSIAKFIFYVLLSSMILSSETPTGAGPFSNLKILYGESCFEYR